MTNEMELMLRKDEQTVIYVVTVSFDVQDDNKECIISNDERTI